MRARNLKRLIVLTLMIAAPAGPLAAQMPTVSAALERKIATHPHVRRLTTWGSRADWSGDSRKLLFLSKEYGDVFELDVATGATRPLTFHFPHKGFFRAYYLANGDILLTGPRDWQPESRLFSRYNDSEVFLMKADLSGPPIPLGIRNFEGIAVARGAMRIAWSERPGPRPQPVSDAQLYRDPNALATQHNQIWIGDIAFVDGKPQIIDKRQVANCGDPADPLNRLLAPRKLKCGMLEPQNFVPASETRLTVTTVAIPTDRPVAGLDADVGVEAISLDIARGPAVLLSHNPPYNEPEGVFPSGRFLAVEHGAGTMAPGLLERLDLWRLATDGGGKMQRMTFYNQIDPQLKSNQPVISPDGKWMAFGVSTGEIERKVPGQGVGLFLMDLTAAGFADAEVRR